jgi:hypothetical protein
MWMRSLLSNAQRSILSNLECFVSESCSKGLPSTLNDYTLHNDPHWKNVEHIAGYILKCHKAKAEDLIKQDVFFLLISSIITHDIAMYLSFTENDLSEITKLEHPGDISNYIRKIHNDLIPKFFDLYSNEMRGIGLKPQDIKAIIEIAKLHRVYDFNSCNIPLYRKIGVVLRLADELDIGYERAPINAFVASYNNFNELAKRHWCKHIVTANWREDENIYYSADNHIIKFHPMFLLPKLDLYDFMIDIAAKPIIDEINTFKLNEYLNAFWHVQVEIVTDKSFSSQFDYGIHQDAIYSVLASWRDSIKHDKTETKKYFHSDSRLVPGRNFVYRKATYDTLSDKKAVNKNSIGKALYARISSDFKTIPAKKELKNKLLSTWEPPLSQDLIFKKETIQRILSVPHSVIEPLFTECSGLTISDYLENAALELVNWAKGCRAVNRYQLLIGERGTGKTQTLNTILIGKRDIFRKNKIFWIRISLLHEIVAKNASVEEEIKERIYAKFSDIIFDSENEYFEEFSENNILRKSLFINKNRYFASVKDAPAALWHSMKEFSEQRRECFFGLFASILFEEGYNFIVIYDNLDSIEYSIDQAKSRSSKSNLIDHVNRWNEITKATLSLAFNKLFIKFPYLNIIVARGTTLNDVLPQYVDTRVLEQGSIRILGKTDYEAILSKRISWIAAESKNEVDNILGLDLDGINWKFPFDVVIRTLGKYITEPHIEDTLNFISGLSGNSASDFLDKVKTVITSHLIDYKPMLSDAMSKQESSIKSHQILWSLMLPNDRLFYKQSDSGVYNVYSTYNDDTSYKKHSLKDSAPILKRLILYKMKYDGDNIMRTEDEFIHDFSYILFFDQEDVRRSVADLVKHEFISKITPMEGKIPLYTITPKGIFFRNHVITQFIYHELVLEDTLVPEDLSLKFKLFEYEPIIGTKNYFIRKEKMVNEFLEYLEDCENSWLNMLGIKHWFHNYRIFPFLREDLERQKKAIRTALSI